MTQTSHPLVGRVVRWAHGPNVLVGPATHYDEEDDELFIVPEGLVHGHYWVPATECTEIPAHVCEECRTCGMHDGQRYKCCGCYDGVCCQNGTAT